MDSKRCKNCNSTLTYIRIKTNERVCRKCGKAINLDTVEKEVENNGFIEEKEEKRKVQEDR